jgi:hypothetical protein
MKSRIAVEWEHFLWFIGWKQYCLPCDAIYGQLSKAHGHCMCRVIDLPQHPSL